MLPFASSLGPPGCASDMAAAAAQLLLGLGLVATDAAANFDGMLAPSFLRGLLGRRRLAPAPTAELGKQSVEPQASPVAQAGPLPAYESLEYMSLEYMKEEVGAGCKGGRA